MSDLRVIKSKGGSALSLPVTSSARDDLNSPQGCLHLAFLESPGIESPLPDNFDSFYTENIQIKGGAASTLRVPHDLVRLYNGFVLLNSVGYYGWFWHTENTETKMLTLPSPLPSPSSTIFSTRSLRHFLHPNVVYVVIVFLLHINENLYKALNQQVSRCVFPSKVYHFSPP
jgi:hypothetical protein